MSPTASEWVGTKAGERNVIIEFMTRRLKIHVMDSRKNSLRLLDLRNVKKIDLLEALDGGQTLLQIKVPRESDLVCLEAIFGFQDCFCLLLSLFPVYYVGRVTSEGYILIQFHSRVCMQITTSMCAESMNFDTIWQHVFCFLIWLQNSTFAI